MSAVEQVRQCVREMRDEMADWDPTEPETRHLSALVRLLECAADDAAGVEAMNARTAERAERTGGDGHTWVMHQPAWAAAIEAADSWREAHR